jgi:hypothetical protein
MADEPPTRDGRDNSESTDGLSDGTLGGYLAHHARPPAFEASDGYPYTVSVELEKTPDLLAPFAGYLVFPRWAKTGAGIIGHLETPLLKRGKSRQQVASHLEALTLQEVQHLLEEALTKRKQETE